jgi:hypothetical protein
VDESAGGISGAEVAAHHDVDIAALLEDHLAARTPARVGTVENQVLSTNSSDDVLY